MPDHVSLPDLTFDHDTDHGLVAVTLTEQHDHIVPTVLRHFGFRYEPVRGLYVQDPADSWAQALGHAIVAATSLEVAGFEACVTEAVMTTAQAMGATAVKHLASILAPLTTADEQTPSAPVSQCSGGPAPAPAGDGPGPAPTARTSAPPLGS